MMEDESKMKFSSDRAKKMVVWLGVASIAMFFAAFTSAYIVLQADHFWVQNDLPQMFKISTVLLVISSLTIYLAKRSTVAGNIGGLKLWLVATFILGLGFTATQYLGWSELQSEGKFFLGTLGNMEGEYGVDYTIMMKGEPVLYDQGNFYKPGDISYSDPINERIQDTFNVSASFLLASHWTRWRTRAHKKFPFGAIQGCLFEVACSARNVSVKSRNESTHLSRVSTQSA